MEMLSSLLAFCETIPLITRGFPSQRTSNAELWCFFMLWCQPGQAVKKTCPVAGYVRRHCVYVTLTAQRTVDIFVYDIFELIFSKKKTPGIFFHIAPKFFMGVQLTGCIKSAVMFIN